MMRTLRSAVFFGLSSLGLGCGGGGPFDLTLSTEGLPLGPKLHVSVAQADKTIVLDDQAAPTGDSGYLTFGGLLARGESYSVDAFLDLNDNGMCDTAPSDRMWHNVTGAVSEEVTLDLAALKLDQAACQSFGAM